MRFNAQEEESQDVQNPRRLSHAAPVPDNPLGQDPCQERGYGWFLTIRIILSRSTASGLKLPDEPKGKG